MPITTQEKHTERPVMLAEVRDLCATGSAKAIRVDARIKRVEFADAVEVTTQTLRRWEEAIDLPTGPRAIRYLELLRAVQAGVTKRNGLPAVAPEARMSAVGTDRHAEKF